MSRALPRAWRGPGGEERHRHKQPGGRQLARGRRGQPVCTDLTSDPNAEIKLCLGHCGTAGKWVAFVYCGGGGPGVVQQRAISPFTQSPADDGFDQWTSWQFEDFLT